MGIDIKKDTTYQRMFKKSTAISAVILSHYQNLPLVLKGVVSNVALDRMEIHKSTLNH